MAHAWQTYSLLFAAGGVAGTLNVIAGGGSFLTIPLLIFLGLPATVANGTNRVGILLQNVGAVWGFHRHGLVRRRWIAGAALPATAGAVVGTLLAIRIGDRPFERILAILMVLAAAWTLWDPLGRRAPHPSGAEAGPGWPGWLPAAGFFGIGIYAGFVQAGAGFLFLGLTTLIGLDLVRGNALKVLAVLVLTPVALALFAAGGKVDWAMGLALGLGTAAGGQVGVHLTVLKGHAWVKRVVTAAILAFALKLWLAP
ncbi:MAG: sulfite exporter TauE/SafE family protein [Gemmatimonadota bacterium]